MTSGERPTVLLVDDNPELLLTVSRYLRGKALEVLTADSPLGVTNVVRRESPDVVVLDVTMPALSGDALAKLLRSQTLQRQPAIVFFSALDEESLHRMTRQFGDVSYVSKTSGLDELHVAIQEALAARG